jgi:hypothetical protein
MQACQKRFYRWGAPKPSHRSDVAKGWGAPSSIEVCEEWADREKSRYGQERRLAELVTKTLKRDLEVLQEEKSFREQFIQLANQWRRETKFLSSSDEKILHPAYQSIIAMGNRAVPLVLEELQSRRGHWFWALKFMTNGVDPLPAGANVETARQAWIAWGKQKGFLK